MLLILVIMHVFSESNFLTHRDTPQWKVYEIFSTAFVNFKPFKNAKLLITAELILIMHTQF
jgi:hypothetical protein